MVTSGTADLSILVPPTHRSRDLVVHSCYACCIAAAIFSAAIRVGKLVLAHGTTGKIEASTTRKPCTPLTRPCVSTTAIGSSARPIRHVHEAGPQPIAA